MFLKYSRKIFQANNDYDTNFVCRNNFEAEKIIEIIKYITKVIFLDGSSLKSKKGFLQVLLSGMQSM